MEHKFEIGDKIQGDSYSEEVDIREVVAVFPRLPHYRTDFVYRLTSHPSGQQSYHIADSTEFEKVSEKFEIGKKYRHDTHNWIFEPLDRRGNKVLGWETNSLGDLYSEAYYDKNRPEWEEI